MERLEKVLNEIHGLLEEEYNKVLLEDTLYKKLLEKVIINYNKNEDDTPLGRWTELIINLKDCCIMLKKDNQLIEDLFQKILDKVNEYDL